MTRLLQERRRHGWTQLELAYRASVQPGDISRIETGRLRPYPGQLSRLARALGVTQPADLLNEVVQVFIHVNQVDGQCRLSPGTPVEFLVTETAKGLRALHVTVHQADRVAVQGAA